MSFFIVSPPLLSITNSTTLTNEKAFYNKLETVWSTVCGKGVKIGTMEIIRCPWPANDELMTRYHDEEWGVPLHDDRKLFEFIVLDAFQAGLSWKIVLYKRRNFEKAFDDFEPAKIAAYTREDYERLVNDAGIIRNRAKIQATITNAQKFLEVQTEVGSFDSYIWGFVEGKPAVNQFKRLEDLPTKNELSDKVSKDLTKRGFKFVGTTITYSFLEAAGLINDHLSSCFRYKELTRKELSG
jgi:DNA-3-methyladenine glycosylase I